jgi:PHD/YefM family antitoxin component YafN of YafNO toxin-antitoxin module
MTDIANGTQPLTAFRRRAREFLEELRRSKRPIVLTVRGQAALVARDVEAYWREMSATHGVLSAADIAGAATGARMSAGAAPERLPYVTIAHLP